jgi:ABC-type polysaccharide/polyol phosphate transport system ATPase subunit
MIVRLAFASAITVRPELLIVDEALAVGDIFFNNGVSRESVN